MVDNRELGNRGEQLAAAFLQEQQYHILEHQYRYRRGDIDLICIDPRGAPAKTTTLVFVEVKTRKSYRFGRPEQAVTPAKQARIVRIAEVYLQEQGLEEIPCRFDVLAVTLQAGRPAQIRHFKDAFWAS